MLSFNGMLFAVIIGPTYDNAKQQLLQANDLAEGIELRLDLMNPLSESEKQKLLEQSALPFILNSGEATLLIQSETETQTLCSYHNFTEMPKDLNSLLSGMLNQKTDVYKIAVLAHSTLDALSMLHFIKEKTEQGIKIAGICMGEKGQVSRILAPVFGSALNYALIDQVCAPGQLYPKNLENWEFDKEVPQNFDLERVTIAREQGASEDRNFEARPTLSKTNFRGSLGIKLSELTEVYHYYSLNKDTQIYGLIGSPIVQSQSHITHNAFFRGQGLDAVYVKMQIEKEELSSFFSLAKKLGIKGLSVTIPLKEAVIPFLDEIDPLAKEIGAVNTILFENGKLKGYNTDAAGALDAIEARLSVRNKKVIILGAGGAAKAIAYEAKRRGADLTIVARTAERAQSMVENLGASLRTFEEIQQIALRGYDILINTTSEADPIDPEFILENSLIMDINTKHRETAFILAAQKKNCTVVYGYEMFMNQASGQFRLWFPQLQNYFLDSSYFLNNR
jgi:3-dehydroquinate dehydratase/shikimate dehydrogenase